MFKSISHCGELLFQKHSYGVSLCIQSECGKIREKCGPEYGHFLHSGRVLESNSDKYSKELHETT